MVETKGAMRFSIKALSDEGQGNRRTFEGDLSTYGNIDLGGDVCEPGCFDNDISICGTHRPLLWQHDARDVIGSLDIVTTEGTLRIKGEVDLDTMYGPTAYTSLKHGDITGLSIGYEVRDYRYDENGVRHLLDVALLEGSVVTFPMNPSARVDDVKARRLKMSRYETCKFLAKMSDEERAAALAELDALDQADKEDPEPEPEAPAPEPEPEPEDQKEDTPEETPDDETPDAKEDEDDTISAIRSLKEGIDKLLSKLEAPA